MHPSTPSLCVNLLLAFLFSVDLVASSNGENVIVNCAAGEFEGAKVKAPNGQSYVSFRGIPYAKPPVGDLRFARPVPLPVIDGKFDATQNGNTCPYPDVLADSMANEIRSEDCLVLNIFIKSADDTKKQGAKKKVLVFIHGGGYILGSSTRIDMGSFVTEQDVVMVTINYRLGILGFLSTENEASPGNNGLWDMKLALEWVKKNIASFGGDADDVAISGESAGGSAVSYLALSSHTKGLFTKVYAQSGTASSFFGISRNPQSDAVAFAAYSGCWDGDTSAKLDVSQSKTLIECLQKLPLESITKFVSWTLNKPIFVPTVDGDFVPKPPLELMNDDSYLQSIGFFDKAFLLGVNNNEHAIMDRTIEMVLNIMNSDNETTAEEKTAAITQVLEASWYYYVASRTGIEENLKEIIGEVFTWYKRHYADDNAALLELMTDLNFLIPTFDFAEAAARSGSGKVWLLYFNHFPNFMIGPYRGTVHGADLLYWFDAKLQEIERILQAGIDTEAELDSEDLELKSLFSSIIAEFTKTGDLEKTPVLLKRQVTIWRPYSSDLPSYLDLSLHPNVKVGLLEDKRYLWDRVDTKVTRKKTVRQEL